MIIMSWPRLPLSSTWMELWVTTCPCPSRETPSLWPPSQARATSAPERGPSTSPRCTMATLASRSTWEMYTGSVRPSSLQDLRWLPASIVTQILHLSTPTLCLDSNTCVILLWKFDRCWLRSAITATWTLFVSWEKEVSSSTFILLVTNFTPWTDQTRQQSPVCTRSAGNAARSEHSQTLLWDSERTESSPGKSSVAGPERHREPPA